MEIARRKTLVCRYIASSEWDREQGKSEQRLPAGDRGILLKGWLPIGFGHPAETEV